METILSLVVQAALLFGGFKLWRWARKSNRAARTKWRRRFATVFFLSPFFFSVLLWMFDNPVVEKLAALSIALDTAVGRLTGALEKQSEELGAGAMVGFAMKPLVRCLVYGALGALVGWPADYLQRKKAAKEDEQAQGKE